MMKASDTSLAFMSCVKRLIDSVVYFLLAASLLYQALGEVERRFTSWYMNVWPS